MQYEFGEGARVKLKDPDAVAAELERIRKKHRGLTARVTWEESRSVKALLHGEFEWNNDEAADLYRDTQARHVIQSVRIVRPDETGARAYVHVVTGGRAVYARIGDVMRSADLRAQALDDVRGLIAGLRRRLEEMEGFAGALAALKTVEAELESVGASR